MLTRLRLENFKSWENTGDITFRPITGFFGTNSSGKTSLFQALLLMKQTIDSPDPGIVLHFGDEKTLVDLGDFESVVHEHDTDRSIRLSLGWNSEIDLPFPDTTNTGTPTSGNEIGFDVDLAEENVGSGKSPILRKMAYSVRGRRFGLAQVLGRKEHDLFVSGAGLDRSHRVSDDGRLARSIKFHEFRYWLPEFFKDPAIMYRLQYALELFLRDLFYLGPLRAYPSRIYARSGAQPRDMGPAGEFAVDAILSSRERGRKISHRRRSLSFERYVAQWLMRLGLIYDFRVVALTKGRRLFEVRVRKSPNSAEVLLTDIGFGVSQILPVLVLCFYVPRKSKIILEQPEIHLHPSVQAGLADVFVDAWKQRNVQVLFESHSEHLLLRLQRRIAEGKIKRDDVSLFFCSMDDRGVSTLSQLEVDDFGNISNWPRDFFGDQFGEIANMNEAAQKRKRGTV